VITPYAAHARLLRDLFDKHTEHATALTVDTIDSFQGSEKIAIIISLVRSNADGDLGFLGRPTDRPRRLNVALTRAKRYCAVVGNFHTLRYDSDGKCTDLYQRFTEHFESTGRLNDVDPPISLFLRRRGIGRRELFFSFGSVSYIKHYSFSWLSITTTFSVEF